MKKFYLIALFAMVCNFASAQIESVAYRGAFAPAPAAMWTDSWTNWNPKTTTYADESTVVNVTTDITTNTTWTAGTTYKITGLIYVRNNATLTIQPGVTVKGVYTTTGTALVITKGAKLNAIGTAASPIVFTSNNAAGSRSPGDWGGIILLGKARFTALASGNTGVNNIEGITASVNTEYGGGTTPNDADSSGTLKYVRIEFGGFVFSNNNEINGLTFGAVGSGTTIDYVQVSYSNDDSFEWFGGAVNCKHLVAYRGLDDDFDTDNGYKGAVQFALGIKDPTIADNPVVSNSEGFESDNNPTAVAAQSGWDNTTAIFSNCTLIGPSGRIGISVATGHERPLRLRRTTQLKVYNSIFLDFKSNYLFVEANGTPTTEANALANTLKFQNNIIAGAANATYTAGVRGSSASSLNTWFTSNNNSYVASAGILTAPYNTSDYNDYNANGTTIDYRPGTLAATGASFSDSSIAALVATPGSGNQPTTSALSYCKGTTGVPALTATLSATGVSLKWYTVATGGTASTTTPIPSTGTVGTKTYYVSEVDGSSVESARTPLAVTILAIPTVGLGVITGTVDSLPAPTTVGQYLGTTTLFTYSVVASTEVGVTSYLWTVPAGVNIISGQGTNSITVNYANVPQGAGDVGTISVQAINASLCGGKASILKIKKALSKAPTLKMYDKASAKPTTPLTSFGQFAGTSTPVTLEATPVATATSYQWELPAGVTPVFGSVTPVTTTVTYTAEPFLSPASTPSTVGTKYWVVTYNTYNGVMVNGIATKIVTSTAVQKIFGNAAYGGTTTAAYLRYGTVITSDLPSILVSFAGVTSSSIVEMYLGVKSVNGVGASVTDNSVKYATAIANNVPGINYTVYTESTTPAVAPSTNATSTYTVTGTTPSTAKLLKVVSVLPSTPSIKSLNGTISVTDISTYVGTTNVLTLSAKAIANASSYTWTLPAGVNQISGGNTNVITVNYAGVAPGTPTVVIAVKANNNVGSSADGILTLTAGAPATVAAPTGSLAICPSAASSVTYTIVALAKNATSYNITLPAGATIAGNSTATIAAVANATFTVDYASGFVSTTTTPLYITIQSENGFGVSLANRSLKLTNVGAVCGSRIASSAKELESAATAQVYPNPTSGEFTIELSASTDSNVSMTISSLLGNVVSSKNIALTAGNNVINENISSLSNGVYVVTLVNSTTGEVITKKLIKE